MWWMILTRRTNFRSRVLIGEKKIKSGIIIISNKISTPATEPLPNSKRRRNAYVGNIFPVLSGFSACMRTSAGVLAGIMWSVQGWRWRIYKISRIKILFVTNANVMRMAMMKVVRVNQEREWRMKKVPNDQLKPSIINICDRQLGVFIKIYGLYICLDELALYL